MLGAGSSTLRNISSNQHPIEIICSADNYENKKKKKKKGFCQLNFTF